MSDADRYAAKNFLRRISVIGDEEYVDSRRRWEAKIAYLDAEIKQLMDGMELAWGLIANAADVAGDGKVQHWQEAMERWRDEHWHPSLDRNGYTRESEVNDEIDSGKPSRAIKEDFNAAKKAFDKAKRGER